LARSPAALAAYLGLRRAGGEYGKLEPSIRAAIMLTTGAVDGGAYSQAIATQLGIGTGMTSFLGCTAVDGRRVMPPRTMRGRCV
jgi:hypothetical protein